MLCTSHSATQENTTENESVQIINQEQSGSTNHNKKDLMMNLFATLIVATAVSAFNGATFAVGYVLLKAGPFASTFWFMSIGTFIFAWLAVLKYYLQHRKDDPYLNHLCGEE